MLTGIRRQFLLISFFLFAITELFAQTRASDFSFPRTGLKRDYDNAPYCSYCLDHVRGVQKFYPDFVEFLPIIPPSTVRCYEVDCSSCKSVWVTEYLLYNDEEGDVFGSYWDCECKPNHFDKGYEQWWPTWTRCDKGAIYSGYFDLRFFKYISFFKRYLQHLQEHSSCHCFWPEESPLAAEISNTAYRLFQNLLV